MTTIDRVVIQEGSAGRWKIERFCISERDAMMAGIRSLGSGRGSIQPGEYTRLMRGHTVVMSDTPDEMRDHYPAVWNAKGHVLVNGLGIGMVLGAILRKPEVDQVTVVEIDQDVIDLVGHHYACDRLEIVNASAFDYQPPAGVRYGAIWHDIWDDLCADNLPQMTKLKRRYGRRTDWQGCWGEEYIRRRARR